MTGHYTHVPSLKALSYKERLMKLNLPTLTNRHVRGDMIEVYKILYCYLCNADGVTFPRN